MLRARHERRLGGQAGPLRAPLNRAAATRSRWAAVRCRVYDELTGTRPFTTYRARGNVWSELVSTRTRTPAGKLGLPCLAETINEYTRRADEGKMDQPPSLTGSSATAE